VSEKLELEDVVELETQTVKFGEHEVEVPRSVLVKHRTHQTKETPRREHQEEDGRRVRVQAVLRWDDRCGNGHNTFSVTGQTWEVWGGLWKEASCGSIHGPIAKAFPELAHLIKWHLVSSDGPLYYVKNVSFLAGDRDCWGLRKGEARSTEYYLAHYTPTGHQTLVCEWPDSSEAHPDFYPPPKPLKFSDPVAAARAAAERGATVKAHASLVSQGKERELDAARIVAVWPDATDEELTAPGLVERLVARLPRLMKEFKADIEALGFTY